MKILSALSRLIDYPSQEVYEHGSDFANFIANDGDISELDKKALLGFIEQRFGGD